MKAKTLDALRALMSDGRWRTLREIVEGLRLRGCYVGETSASARLRDLRKARGGYHTVEGKQQTARKSWCYRVVKQ